MINALLVEDNYDLAAAIVDYLSLESIDCDHAADGITALQLMAGSDYQVLILDLNLPRLDGLSVCQRLRDQGADIPVLMLTARDSLGDKLAGFDAGTDDYLVKPFSMDELLARVRALSGRRSVRSRKLQVADLMLDLNRKQVQRGGRVIRHSPTGFAILEILMRASPDPVSRQHLVQTVWGDDAPGSNSLKVHIHNLRKQIDLPGEAALLQTVPGHGYAIKDAHEDPVQS